jgi:hypothetical protein
MSKTKSVAVATIVTLVLLLTAACAAMTAQKAQGVHPDSGEFHNLKVLPQNITHDELIATMRAFSRSLGVKCDHCHAAAPAGSKDHLDFASDAKPEKDVARAMMRMTRQVNADYISKVNEHGTTVTCYTCHRGKVVPEGTLPPAPDAQQQPRGATPAPPAPTPQP